MGRGSTKSDIFDKRDIPSSISYQNHRKRTQDTLDVPILSHIHADRFKTISKGDLLEMFSARNSQPDPTHICLCQPTPKIPRPRNAFILFRQHHHAAIMAQNPGKPNPIISKIIGDMWKASSQEVRDQWQAHAEEEKRQHMQRYPEYRYQPRRTGKKPVSSSNSGSSVNEVFQCPRCGGRTGSITVSETPEPSTSSSGALPTFPSIASSSLWPPSTGQGGRSLDLNPMYHKRKRSSIEREDFHHGGAEALLQLGSDHGSQPGSRSMVPASPRRKRRRVNVSSQSTPKIASSPAMSYYSIHDTPAGRRSSEAYDRASVHRELQQNQVKNLSPSQTLSSRFRPLIPAEPGQFEKTITDKLNYIKTITKFASLNTPTTQRQICIIAIETEDNQLADNLSNILRETLTKDRIDIKTYVTMNSSEWLTFASGEAISEGDLVSEYLRSVANIRKHISSMVGTQIKGLKRTDPMVGGSNPASTSSTGSRSRPQTPMYAVTILIQYIYTQSSMVREKMKSVGDNGEMYSWEWFADVWRGSTRPDITILVRNDRTGNVTVEPEDPGIITIPLPTKGSSWDGSVLRRLTFEVQEYLRNLQLGGGEYH